jgi:hypothetical protein
MLIANQSGWFVLNDFGFTALWTGKDAIDSLSVQYDSAKSVP